MTRSLLATVAALGLIWIVSLTALMFVIAGLASTAALIVAIVCQVAVVTIGSSLLLVTNVRRPAGIDPNAPDAPPGGMPERRESPGRRQTDVHAGDVRAEAGAILLYKLRSFRRKGTPIWHP